MAEPQTIPARHGVATFVPAGQVIKIINTSGTQVIDTWAFALPKPEPKKENEQQEQESKEEKGEEAKPSNATPKKKQGSDLPSQQDAEKATGEAEVQEAEDNTPKKSTWSSYVPSLGLGGGKKTDGKEQPKGDKNETEQQKNSRTWSSYFTAGQGFSSYIPKQATDTVTQFTAMHERDAKKGYLEQLQDLSKTPVGAAGYSGMAAITGSGYAGSLYAGYQAWNAKYAANAVPMEFMSMSHSRAASLHMIPQVDDTLVTNLREPILTLIEDKSPGIHDTLIAACDPARYKGLGVAKWEEHGSCAENLVLALKELNERAGLKGAKAVGADITVNTAPAPLNLFMNIPWDDDGDIGFKSPKSKSGDYVRLRAERDTVVVMSACPQDILDINNKKPTDANFIVEAGEDTTSALKRTAQPKKKAPPPRKAPPPAKKPSTTAPATSGAKPPATAPPKKKPIPAPAKTPESAEQGAQPAKKAPQPVKSAAPSSTPAAKPVKKPPPPASNTTAGDAKPPVKKTPRKISRPAAAAGGET